MSVGTSTANSFACGTGSRAILVSYRFAEGSIVYSIFKAQEKGVLEAVAIKSVRFVASRATFGGTNIIYTDTFNGWWNEDELCTEEEARQYALNYFDEVTLAAEEQLGKCSF